MSDANSAKQRKMQQQGNQERAEAHRNAPSAESKVPWFNYMKKDELAPEETREIAFLGYN